MELTDNLKKIFYSKLLRVACFQSKEYYKLTCSARAAGKDNEVWAADVLATSTLAVAPPIHAASNTSIHCHGLSCVQAIYFHQSTAIKLYTYWLFNLRSSKKICLILVSLTTRIRDADFITFFNEFDKQKTKKICFYNLHFQYFIYHKDLR